MNSVLGKEFEKLWGTAPSAFLRRVDAVCENQIWNHGRPSRMTLEYDVCGALAGWLYRTGWVKWLLGEATISQQVYLVCERIGQRRLLGDRAQYLIRMSLVARYLIAYASIGARVNNISDVRERLMNATGIGISLPYYWPLPPSDGKCEFRRGRDGAAKRFLRDYEYFWRDKKWLRSHAVSGPNRRKSGDSVKRAVELGFELPTPEEVSQMRIIVYDEELPSKVHLTKRGAFAHACLAAYVQQISRDHRPLGVGIQLLRVAENLKNTDIHHPRLCASLALAHLSLFHGLTMLDGLELAFTAAQNSKVGWVDVDRSVLQLKVGHDVRKSLTGRVPLQIIMTPISTRTCQFLRSIRSRGYSSLGACFGKAALDEIQEELSDFIQTKSEGREFYRLHQAWQYVAVRMVHLNLGTVALLCGDVIGPFRAESSYLTIRQSALGEAVRRIHEKIAQIADQSFQFSSDLPCPTDWKGKGAPDLEVWAKSAASCLDECKTDNELRAACNWLMAAHGRRPTPELPHPGRYYLNSELGSVLYIADKNLGGGRRVRFVPVKNEDYYESLSFIPTATDEKSNGLELGFSSGTRSVSLRALKRIERSRLAEIADARLAPGDARKGLYSGLVENGFGLEMISLCTEHGTNALLPGGPYSLAPLSHYLRIGREAIDRVHCRSGVADLLQKLGQRLGDFGENPVIGQRVPNLSAFSSPDDQTCVELPGWSSLPLPLPEEWQAFERARTGFERLLKNLETQSLDRLRYSMIFALCEAGVPLRNILRRYRYYRFGSFIAANGKLWFLSLIRQVDAGLGLLPVLITDSESRMLLLTRMIGGKSGVNGRQLIGADFQPTLKGLVKFLRVLLRSEVAEAAGWDDWRIKNMIDRCSTFTSLVKIGGFLTFSLRDQLILPANYYDIRDLFATMGVNPTELKGLDGERWSNPYVPSTEALDRALSEEELFVLMGLKGMNRERKRALPGWCAGKDIRTLPNDDLAKLIAFYIPCPTFPFLCQLGLLLEGGSETAATLRARQIVLVLNKKGLGHVGKPIRLVPPEKFLRFLEKASNEELAARTWQPITKDRVSGLLSSIAFTGMRLGEAIRVRRGDIFDVGNYETIFVDGTKVDRAKRTVPLHALRIGPNAEELYKSWQRVLTSIAVASAGEPLFASKDEGSRRYSDLLKSVLSGAFVSINTEVEGEDPRTVGTFTAYSLRHAAALRLIQGAIDSDFVHGNFACALAEISQCLGHSLPTLLSSYLGTACLALRWP